MTFQKYDLIKAIDHEIEERETTKREIGDPASEKGLEREIKVLRRMRGSVLTGNRLSYTNYIWLCELVAQWVEDCKS